MKQILLNLLSNAVKFTPRGGHISHQRAEADADRVSVSVRDDGIGIPPDALPRLGRAFEQVATNPFISKTGTGLGLALVRSLCERHGGEMQIESLEGVGTTVAGDARAADAWRKRPEKKKGGTAAASLSEFPANYSAAASFGGR